MIKETMIKNAINKIYIEATIKSVVCEINNIDYAHETMTEISKTLDGIREKLNKLLEVK
tara:strand:- start:4457 stop:4633 length:177 start_codon:yes stop_codon:yes gene_type:complete